MDVMTSRPLEIFVIPFLGPSHLFPLFEMARLFAARGEHITIFTTPSNVPKLQKSIDKDVAAGRHISLHVIPLPTKQFDLPDGNDFSSPGNDMETSKKLYMALCHLRPELENYIETHRPDCIISDKFYPWTPDVAARLGIPRIVYHCYSMFGQSILETMSRPESPHWTVESDYEPFVVPGLPDSITMTRSRVPIFIRTKNDSTQLVEIWREADLKSYGVLVNSFYELESAYAEYYQKLMGIKVFHIGPAALVHKKTDYEIEKSAENNSIIQKGSDHKCLSWLDSKEPDSVLFLCFGSYCIFPDEQLVEIACALESSAHQFIWVVHGKGKDEEEEEKGEKDKEKWLPKGFEERMNDRGMIVKGWAPQVHILEHPSVGGFLTHCGCSSMYESVCAGVPMITWPLYGEQFYNEKLLSEVAKIGVEVGVEDWNLWVDLGKNLVRREKIEKAVRRLMDVGNEESEVIRRNARELSNKAKGSVEEGGSSHRNLTVLIEQLKRLREHKSTV